MSDTTGRELLAKYGPTFGDVIGNLERELSAANARIAELEKDAARYRWLRRSQLNGDEPFIARFECGSFSRWCGDMADSAIDDAMRPSQPTTLPESKQQK